MIKVKDVESLCGRTIYIVLLNNVHCINGMNSIGAYTLANAALA